MVAKLRSSRACSDLLTQEKAEQDEEHRLVHEDKKNLAAELQALERRRRRRGTGWKLETGNSRSGGGEIWSNDRDTGALG